MFRWLFKKKDNDDWATGGVQSGSDLVKLAASNPVVATEVDVFTDRIDITKPETWEEQAVISAKTLSGYGISVSKTAFVEYIQLQTSAD